MNSTIVEIQAAQAVAIAQYELDLGIKLGDYEKQLAAIMFSRGVVWVCDKVRHEQNNQSNPA